MPAKFDRDPQKDMRTCNEASPEPWYYDSYSTIRSLPLSKATDAKVREFEADQEKRGEASVEEWKALARSIPNSKVCQVPVVAGDTATEQGGRDAQMIADSREGWPAYIREVVRLRKLLGDVKFFVELLHHDLTAELLLGADEDVVSHGEIMRQLERMLGLLSETAEEE